MKFLIYQILSFFFIILPIIANNLSLSFDGQNDYVDLGQSLLSGTGDFSISLWANSSSSSSDQILIQKRDVNGFNGEYLLLFQSNGTIKIWTYRNGYQWTVVSPQTYNDGLWHHIVAVQDNSINGGRLYVDGIEVGSSSNGVVNLMGPLRTYLGADMRDFNRYFNGFLDNIMIYSDVLTTDEIELLYNNDNTLNDNIVGYWNCNTGSGDILYDQSGNQNNGTINGALWSINTAAKSIYVSTLGSDENGDGSEEDPYSTIQKGIDNTNDGDTVIVAVGTYIENINFNGKNIAIIGEERSTTIIDANQSGSAVTFDNGETSNCFLSGFTLTNGTGQISGEGANMGGGIYINAPVRLHNLIIHENIVPAVYFANNCGESILANCSIINNDGYGIITRGSAKPVIQNCIVANNGSLGIEFDSNSGTLINCTIVNNQADVHNTGGIKITNASSDYIDILNTIVYGNQGLQMLVNLSSNEYGVNVHTSLFQNGLEGVILWDGNLGVLNWGEENMDSNPIFIDPHNNNYHLSDFSPAIGSGQSERAPITDLENNPRPNPAGTNPDMGAYESLLGEAEAVIYGDVTMNGTVSSFDASKILKHVVGLDTLSYLQNFFGDVSQNNELSSLDASYILQYVVGLIDELPYTPDNVLSNGEFIMEDMHASIGETIHIPIKIINESNIHSFSGILHYNSEILSLDTITTGNYFANSILISNENDGGEVYIALSGFDPNHGSDELAKAIFTVLNEFNNHTTVTLTDLELNENDAIESEVSMYINSTLNIDQQLPTIYTLYQNYPNPFNPSTEIRYFLNKEESANIAIYDVIGNKIKLLVNERKSIGHHTVEWGATNTAGERVSAGMYFYSIEAGSFKQTKKMIYLK